MNTIIVEDELFSTSVIKSILNEYCPWVNVIDEINSASAALEKLPTLNPDLVFFDIELGDGNAFDVLSKLNTSPPIIFTTAYNHFAIKAFKFSAIDYLLKPINIKELVSAVGRARASMDSNLYNERLKWFIEQNKDRKPLKQIALPTLAGFSFVEIDSIVRFEAEGSYSRVLLGNKEDYLLSYNLKHYEDMLKDECFFRVHYSHFINLNMISKYVKGNGGYLVMKDGSKVDVASRRKEELMKYLKIH